MKTSSISIKKVAAITGLFLGAFALSVFAGSWTAAPLPAPDGNTGAPINVTDSDQFKFGRMSVFMDAVPTVNYQFEVGGKSKMTGLLVTGRTITDTITIGGVDIGKNGYVLTNDGTGDATWKAPAVQALTVSAVDSFSITIPRPTSGAFATESFTTATPYLFCAISKMDNFANSDKDYSSCSVTRLSDGKWTISGKRGDDPQWTCEMTCFK
jgi:hypothetical protein